MSLNVLKTQLQSIQKYLDDPCVQDVIANSDGSIWLSKAGHSELIHVGHITSNKIECIINSVASVANKELKNIGSILECEIPHSGERFEAILPPIAFAPAFVVRCKSKHVFTLESYLERNALSQTQYGVLLDSMEQKKNILIVGGTSTGKTALINALMHSTIGTTERFVVCEDTPEIVLPNSASQKLLTSEKISFNDLVRATLRLRPDRIILGEIRGKEALEFIKAMNTGHQGGLSSIHANSAEEALFKLDDFCGEATLRDCKQAIAKVIDLVVFLKKSQSGPVISELIEVKGYDQTTNKFLFNYIKDEVQQ